MTLRYLSSSDVQRLLPSVDAALDLVRASFAAMAAGTTQAPPVEAVHARPTGFAHAMPAYVGHLDATSVKWIGGDERNVERGLPYLGGLILLNDSETSLPAAILDCAAITAARTAAVSGVSINAFATPGWSEVAIVGFGVQARAHVRMLRSLNPDVAIRVATRRPATVAVDGVDVVATPEQAVRGADVVITSIPLSARLRPQVTSPWIKRGALVLPLDDDAATDAGVPNGAELFVVDDVDRYAQDQESGLFAGWRAPDASVPDAIAAGRSNLEQTVVCMNQGIGAMDTPFAEAVLRAAEAAATGVLLPR